MLNKLKLAALLAILPVLLSFGDEAPLRIRMATANITSGTKQSYDPGHGMRIFQAAKPDIVMIQEFNYGKNTPEQLDEFIGDTFGWKEKVEGQKKVPQFYYYREAQPGKKFDIPNGIVSRFPIEESGSWSASPVINNRGYAWAKIKLPDGQYIYAISVHLYSKSAPARQTEAETIVANIKKFFPKDAMLVIGGDFNTKRDDEWCLKVIRDGKVTKEDHHPKKGDGSTAATNQNERYRYDWLLFSPSLDQYHVDLELYTGKTPENKPIKFKGGLVFDTQKLDPLPEPAQKDDSQAVGMQHHMVLKDVVIPVATGHQKRPSVEEDETH